MIGTIAFGFTFGRKSWVDVGGVGGGFGTNFRFGGGFALTFASPTLPRITGELEAFGGASALTLRLRGFV